MAITKADLDKLYHLTGEIRDLDKEIQKTEKKASQITNRMSSTFTGDTYRDYSLNAKGNIRVVRGYGYSDADYKKQQEYYEQLRIYRSEIIDKMMELEREVEKVEDVTVRRIIRLKFLQRLSWESVAIAVEPTKSGTAMRMRLDRYLKKI